MINYDYLRPLKARDVQTWYNTEFVKRNDLRANNYEDAIILPLKKFPEDNLLFGRGGGNQ